MADQITAEIGVEDYVGDEEPFSPGERKVLQFVLEPTVPTVTPTIPREPSFYTPEIWTSKQYSEAKKPLIIDIETTGDEPWNSKLICIGVKDPNQPEMEPLVFLEDHEAATVLKFLAYFTSGGYNQLVGYNVAFDYRFIFTRSLKYGITCQEYLFAELRDIMQVMKQVKEAFVFGNLKSGKLEDWSKYLLGVKKGLTYPELLTAIRLEQWDTVIAYNKRDVELVFTLWTLIKIVSTNNFNGIPFRDVSGGNPNFSGEKSPNPNNKVNLLEKNELLPKDTCPICLAANQIETIDNKEVCAICGHVF